MYAGTTRLLVLCALIAMPGLALAKQPVRAFAAMGEAADAPRGFVDLCGRDSELCRLGSTDLAVTAPVPIPVALPQSPPATMTTAAVRTRPVRPVADTMAAAPARGAAALSDADLMALAKQVNADVNRHFAQKSDYETVGVGEYWGRPGANPLQAGDCEDFAIEKRFRLAAAGVAPERMFYAVAFVRGLGLHTVLVLRLDTGDHVLDSLSARIRPWQKARYAWLRLQVPGQPLAWVRPATSDASVELASL